MRRGGAGVAVGGPNTQNGPAPQLETMWKVSPITPAGYCPGFLIAPVVGSKNCATVPPQNEPGLLGFTGSQFGRRNGFTQRATVGAPVPPKLDEFDGLKASALADTRAVRVLRFQMREKNVGRFVFCTVTFTVGLIPKLG